MKLIPCVGGMIAFSETRIATPFVVVHSDTLPRTKEPVGNDAPTCEADVASSSDSEEAQIGIHRTHVAVTTDECRSLRDHTPGSEQDVRTSLLPRSTN